AYAVTRGRERVAVFAAVARPDAREVEPGSDAERSRLDDRLRERDVAPHVLGGPLLDVDLGEVGDRRAVRQLRRPVRRLVPGRDLVRGELRVAHHRHAAELVEQLLLLRDELCELSLQRRQLVLRGRDRRPHLVALGVFALECLLHLLQLVEPSVVEAGRGGDVLLRRRHVLDLVDVEDGADLAALALVHEGGAALDLGLQLREPRGVVGEPLLGVGQVGLGLVELGLGVGELLVGGGELVGVAREGDRQLDGDRARRRGGGGRGGRPRRGRRATRERGAGLGRRGRRRGGRLGRRRIRGLGGGRGGRRREERRRGQQTEGGDTEAAPRVVAARVRSVPGRSVGRHGLSGRQRVAGTGGTGGHPTLGRPDSLY